MAFPYPFEIYPDPNGPYPNGQFVIPWYMKVTFLRENLDWCLYFGMGISKQKLNGLWIDFVIMGMLQSYFFYFNCQLFSHIYKIVKGNRLKRIFDQYCLLTQGSNRDDVVKKEIKKLKGQIFIYNFYKSA